MELILDFDDVDKSSIQLVGGKNANLGEMIRAGIRVPPGFAVTTESYLEFISRTGIGGKISKLLSDLNTDDMKALNRAAVRAQDLIKNASMPDHVKKAVEQAYSRLCEKSNLEKTPVAVRSSATAEDLPTASFAGQQDTYLWIEGEDRVIDRVQKCWASLFTARAISYRVKNRFRHEKVLISVGVQKMVNAKAAGVMFTLNPTNGDLSKVVIEGSWGLGETVVSGSVTPDKFVVDKVIMEISEKTISRKHIECVYDPRKCETVDRDVNPDLQTQCCMEDREIKELVSMGKHIEGHYDRPMDIEWAIDKDIPFPENVCIVQARPETVWSQKERKSVIGKKTGYQLLMDQAMKRIKIS
jgi:phosphoenolpyruvate synthase